MLDTTRNPEGKVAKADRKTDMYAFAFLAFEILTGLKPFEGVPEDLIISKIIKGDRPDVSLIKAEYPKSLKRLIERCWSPDRNERPTALECYTCIDQYYNVLRKNSYDIFFSHPWTKKSVLRYAKHNLASLGYRVWYDENDTQWDIVRSMKEGVEKSKVVLACISVAYENSNNCMFELTETCKLANKPIITLSTDANPFTWAGQNTTHGDLKQMCGIDGQGKLFFDIGEICARPGWELGKNDDSLIPKKDIDDLNTEIGKVVKLLQGSQLNCKPSLK